MGFISKLAETSGKAAFPGQDTPRHLWREIFGSTDKEETRPAAVSRKPIAGGSFGRGIVSSEASYARLLQAMRSMAPGGWSDDRWTQTTKYTDIRYLCIHRTNEMLAESEFQVFQKDPNHPRGKRPVTKWDSPQGDRMVRPYELVELLEKPNNDD